MQKPGSDIIELISKYCQRNISEAEFIELEKWLNQNTENRQVLSEYLVFFKKVRMVGFYDNLHQKEAWNIVRGRLKRRKKQPLRAWFRYAAILLVPIVLYVSYLIIQGEDKTTFVTDVQVIEPGSSKAILYTSQGQEISLEESIELKETDGTVIQNQANVIKYIQPETKPEELVYNTLHIPRKGEFQLELSDGTKVWLNSDTKLIYPTQFANDIRELELNGEAYFEVAEDQERPFVLSFKGFSVQVLGTAFNVKAYEDECQAQTTLVEGSIKVENGENETKILIPGQQAVIFENNLGIEVKQVETQLYTSWKDGMFRFRSMTLREIMKVFSRWYDVEVQFEEEELGMLHFSGNLMRYKEINPHLKLIALTTHVKFEANGKKITVKRE